MTKTTLRELSHKYATILRRCAILNAMVFGIVASSPLHAQTVTEDIYIAIGETYNITTDGMNISMSSQNFTNNSIIKISLISVRESGIGRGLELL